MVGDKGRGRAGHRALEVSRHHLGPCHSLQRPRPPLQTESDASGSPLEPCVPATCRQGAAKPAHPFAKAKAPQLKETSFPCWDLARTTMQTPLLSQQLVMMVVLHVVCRARFQLRMASLPPWGSTATGLEEVATPQGFYLCADPSWLRSGVAASPWWRGTFHFWTPGEGKTQVSYRQRGGLREPPCKASCGGGGERADLGGEDGIHQREAARAGAAVPSSVSPYDAFANQGGPMALAAVQSCYEVRLSGTWARLLPLILAEIGASPQSCC